MENINDVDFYDFTKDCVTVYGKYVNNFRSIPGLLDGLKPVQIRSIYTALQNKGNHVKVAELAGSATKHHPHGESSLVGVINFLVRKGVLDGQGNFGMTTMKGVNVKPSAPRYVSAWISPFYNKMFSKLLPYVPTYKGEFGYDQPNYLPTPVPLCFVFGSFGIGIGCTVTTPSFTLKSILKAYLNNDPNLLEAPFGYELNKSTLTDLWNNPTGKTEYAMTVQKDVVKGLAGISIKGSTELFIPKVTSKMKQWIAEGRILQEDFSRGTNGWVFYTLAPRIQQPTLEELDTEIRRTISYGIRSVTRTCFNGTVYNVTMKNWVDITYKNYCNLFEKYKKDNLDKYQKQILVYSNFRAVAELMFKKVPSSEIAKQLKIDQWIVNEIGKRSLNTLQTLDADAKVKSIKDKIKNLEAVTGDTYIYDTFIAEKEVDLNAEEE